MICVGKHASLEICVREVRIPGKHSGRNKRQKLVGRFFEDWIFRRLLIAFPLKMYSKFGQPKWILVGQMLELVGKWPAVISRTENTSLKHQFPFMGSWISMNKVIPDYLCFVCT